MKLKSQRIYFLVQTKCVQYSVYFLVCFSMVSCLTCFFLLFFKKKMYNCIILFISFYFVPLEKKLKSIFFLLKMYNNLGIGPGFCSTRAVIPGNCDLVLYHYSKVMHSGTVPLFFVCMKSTQLY